MPKDVLVAYATKYGSTGEVAERIAQRLRSAGLEADLKPVREADGAARYDAVVLGAPLYIGSLLKDAKRFLEQNRQSLAGMPVAVFALGPLEPEEEAEDAGKQLDEALSKAAPWLAPVAKATFVGKYDPEGLRGPDKLLSKLKASPLYGVPKKDKRDWEAIETWADELATRLR